MPRIRQGKTKFLRGKIRLKDALKESIELYQSIFDYTPVMFVLWDPHLKKFSLNPYAENILGWTTAEANNAADFMAEVYPDPSVRKAVCDYMQSLAPGFREWIITTRKGEKIPVDWANKKLSNDVMVGIGIDLRGHKRIESERNAAEKVKAERQKFLNVLDSLPVIRDMIGPGYDIDITPGKKAEKELKKLNEALEYRILERTEALRENQLDFERAQKVGQIGNWRLDLVNNRLLWSDETYNIFGIPKEIPQTYEKFLALVHPDDRELVDKAWNEALAGREYDIEHRIYVNGLIKWVREKAYLEFDAEGKLASGFGIVQDITSRHLTEEKLKQSETKLRMALDSGNIGIWEWNLKTGMVTLDERMRKIFGFQMGVTSCRYKDFEKMIHEDDLTHFKKAVNESINSCEAFETICRITFKKKGTKYISLKAQVTKDGDGNPESFAGVSFDITGLKEGTENLINRLNEELLRSNHELESFAYVASHDLQEPLRMITSFTQLLEIQYGDKLDQKAKEYIAFASNGAKRMYNLINGLLSYSRINKKEVDFTSVDTGSVIDTVLKNLDYTIRERNVIIKTGKLPTVRADHNQMIHLFQNLVSNSIKFCRNTPEIHIKARKGKISYIFSVSDNGIGIEPQYHEKIFQIFQRLNPRDEFDGTGIGLAVCKKIVERHGGRIWIESMQGKGSTFFFSIPAAKNE